MPRLKKKFDKTLLNTIRCAAYHGGKQYQLAERIGIDVKTWSTWRKNADVQRAIKEGENKRKKMMLKKIGFTIVAISEIENNQEK